MTPEEQATRLACLKLALERTDSFGVETSKILDDAKAFYAFVTNSPTEREESDAE